MAKRHTAKKNHIKIKSFKKRIYTSQKREKSSKINQNNDKSQNEASIKNYFSNRIDRSENRLKKIQNELIDLKSRNIIDFIDLKQISDKNGFLAKKDQFSNDLNNSTEIFESVISNLLLEEEQINAKVDILKQKNLWFNEEIIDKAQILPKPRFHWDFMLAEMTWLAEDFGREKAWKRICAKKLANAVVKSLREKRNKISKEAKKETFKLKKNCANIAKIIKDWWKQMEKIVLAKQQFRLNAKRQEAVTTHLGKVIETTERYTEWLTEDLNSSTFNDQSEIFKDPDFTVKIEELENTDNEETIEIDEIEIEKSDGFNKKEELENLQMEGQMDLNDLIELLPEGYISELINGDRHVTEELKREVEDDVRDVTLNCIDSDVIIDNNSDEQSNSEQSSSDESSDNEDTFIEQELFEDNLITTHHDKELECLANDADIPMEELLRNYKNQEYQMWKTESLGIGGGDSSDVDRSASRNSSSSCSSPSISSSNDLNIFFHSIENKNEGGKKEIKNTFGFEGEFEALAEAALSTQPKGFTIESADIKVKVPHLIRHTLREYQCVGLDWLAAIYEKRLNGILADEMGLGKTIQTIALLAYMACEKAIWGPHLIIVPTSVILNWDVEFKKWCPGFKILTYYGSAKERRDKRKGWTKTNAFHVCITSYKLAIQDSLSFKRKKWKYLILDEAQNIKNFKSQRWQTLLTFNSQRRLLLTGTPLQNNLMELWSLMHFLMPHIFQSHKEFQEWFGSPLTGMIEGNAEYNEQLVKRLHKVLRPFILRRLKKDVEKQMPKKYEHVIMCKLSKRQRCLYDDFMSLSSTQETLDSGQFLNVINILMQLRKVCNHPNLFETRPTISPFLIIDELEFKAPRCVFIHDFHLENFPRTPTLESRGSTLAEMALNLPMFVSQRIYGLKVKPHLIEEIDSITVSDWVSRYRLGNRNHSTKASKMFIARNLMSLNFLEDSSQIAGLSENLITSMNSSIVDREDQGISIVKNSEIMERKPQLPEHIIISRRKARNQSLKCLAQRNESRCNIYSSYGPDVIDVVSLKKSDNDPSIFWDTGGLSLTKGKPLDYFFQVSEDIIKRFVFVVPPAISNGIKVNKNSQMRQRDLRFSDTLLPQIKTLIPRGHFQILNQQRVQFPDTRLIQYDCGKLQTLEILLKRLHKENHRCLIFTQMTRMLDILEQFLSYLGYRYLRLDGATKVEQRQIMMEKFNQDSRIFIFILSTRSGGLGINLTGADTVVFYDSDWNPTMDAQAQDRCHRIGQTRDVHIYRLISQMTVEENILKKANQKRTLNDITIEGGQFNTGFFKSNTLQDLFKAPSGLDDLMQEQNITENESIKEKADIVKSNNIITRSGRLVKWKGVPVNTASPIVRKTIVNDNIPSQENMVEMAEFEAALEQIEDENDRLAATKAKAEVKDDLAEFDETIPWEEIDNTNETNQFPNKLDSKEPDQMFHLDTERQIKEFQKQLNPIQRYGVRMIESVVEDTLTDQLEMAQQNLQSSKKTWHLEQLKALHEADEMRAEIEEDDMLYCYGKYDPLSQKKELDRLIKEEAEYVKQEKRKTDEQAKQAKADAARKTWSRQQHLLALKRKHIQSNNRYNKISRTIKQHKVLSDLEYCNNSAPLNNNHENLEKKPNQNSNIGYIHSDASIRVRNHSVFKNNSNRQFYQRLRFNHSSHSFRDPLTFSANRPVFHLPSKSDVALIQNETSQTYSFGKQMIQAQMNHPNQLRFFQSNTFPNYPAASYPNSVKRPRTLAMKTKDSNSTTVSNQSLITTNTSQNNNNNNNNSNNNNNKVTLLNSNNDFVSCSSQSPIQIPMQSFCNFRSSLPTQQLIINSQPVLFINPQMPAQNPSFITQVSNSGSSSMIQIINQNSNMNISQHQNRFCNPSLISDRSINSRFSNILSLQNPQFFLPSLARNPANIIRINCSNSNVCQISKPEYINPNMLSVSNTSSPMLRMTSVTNNNYQSPSSNPLIILNNSPQNKTVISSVNSAMSSTCIPNTIIRPAPVRQIISSKVTQTNTNNLPN